MNVMSKIVITVAVIVSLGLVGFASSGPELTDIQKLRIERINLVNENLALQKENSDLRLQVAGLKVSLEQASLQKDIDGANPGYTWDPKTGQFTPKETPGGDLH